ncbi:MAG TPA: metallophosphoesterase [Granulicella sp.]|jgi:predicted MPP superfamily phosphohydrolase|nr:metallophosphoesterase [Granulicella sp.]
MQQDLVDELEQRLGRAHAQRRLGLESEHEAIFGHGINFFHPENWYSTHSILRLALKLAGLYQRGHRNTERIQIRHNVIELAGLPALFDGFTLLHITDMHADMNPGPMQRLADLLPGLSYDICVVTGDFRGQTFGPFAAALDSLARVRKQLHPPVYAVLGNHDTIRMVPQIEEMGICMLLNESIAIRRGDQQIHLAGVDDAHYYRADNVHKAASAVPRNEVAILLSHTPEIYRQVDAAGFHVMLSGHTHGGQICLPGSIPLTLDSVLPRRMGAGPWRYGSMTGYTSVGVGSSIVPVRLNCPPEITLHHLRSIPPATR